MKLKRAAVAVVVLAMLAGCHGEAREGTIYKIDPPDKNGVVKVYFKDISGKGTAYLHSDKSKKDCKIGVKWPGCTGTRNGSDG